MNTKEHYKYLVHVSCSTFNQAKYIEKAMDGFTMQETTLPFVCTIIDDASTDGEQEVINNYFQKHFDLEDKTIARNEKTDDFVMTFARHKTNRNCYFAVILLKYNHFSFKKSKAPYIKEWQDNAKYIALCEGDDYWINPHKLQKQVDFLETHLDYSLVYTNYLEDVNGELLKGSWNLLEGDCIKPYLLRKGYFPVPSTMFRKEDYYSLEAFPRNRFLMGDVPLWIRLMRKGKVKKLTDITAVYRILPESVSHSQKKEKKLRFLRSAIDVRLYFAEKYGYNDIAKILKNQLNQVDCKLALYEKNYFKFIKMRPWKYHVGPRTIVSIYRESAK